jgi:hypothetical protein
LAPSCSSSFDPLRHLQWGNVTLHSDHLVIWLWWTKTIQSFNQYMRIQLFPIPSSPLCPIRPFQLQLHYFSGRPADPFLSYCSDGCLIILSQGLAHHSPLFSV